MDALRRHALLDAVKMLRVRVAQGRSDAPEIHNVRLNENYSYFFMTVIDTGPHGTWGKQAEPV